MAPKRKSSPEDRLTNLKGAIERGQERRALRPHSSERLWLYLSNAEWAQVHGFVRYLARSHPGSFGAYGHDQEIADALVEVLDEDADGTLATHDDIAAALLEATNRSWLIRTPLANVMAPPAVQSLGPDAALAPTYGRNALVDDSARRTRDAVRTLFGDDIGPGERFDRTRDQVIDTRHTASLITRERGTRRVASDRGATRARYALALWTLAAPPEEAMYMPLWPTLGNWLPQPWMHQEQGRKSLEAPRNRDSGMHVDYEDDDLVLYRPPAEPLASAPFMAMSLAHERRCASALLSAAWPLYLVGRLPTDLTWLDRLAPVYQARDTLCEPPDGDHGDVEARFKAGVDRLRITKKIRRLGYTPRDVSAISARARDVRNIVVHGADAALLNLGFPPERVRRVRDRRIPGKELGPAFVQEAITPAFHAVRFLALALLEQALATGWADAAFEASLGGRAAASKR
ncbi:MAG TPA: hypothetical protein VGW75_04545 [Solirubrobacteraceae bacterium]|nr:hypothetical protein [Solirubrobacteraceae bacterium]